MFHQKSEKELAQIKRAIDERNKIVIGLAERGLSEGLKTLPPVEEMLKREHVRLEEHYFVNIFLPFFAKDKELPFPEVTLEHWIGAVKDPFCEVDLIDVSGNVVITIPAVRDRDLMRTATLSIETRDTISQIVASLQMLNNFGQHEKDKALNGRLNAKLSSYQNGHRFLEIARQWNAVMKHYNRPPLYDLSQLGDAFDGNPGSPSPDSTLSDEYEIL